MVKSKSPSIRRVACLAVAGLATSPYSFCFAQDGNLIPLGDNGSLLRASYWSGDEVRGDGLIEDVASVRRLPALPRQALPPSPLPQPITITAAPKLHLASAPMRINTQAAAMPMEAAVQSRQDEKPKPPPLPLPPPTSTLSTPTPTPTPSTPSNPTPSKVNKAEDKSPPTNFLPSQLPISGINIDVRAKSEKGNDTRPKSQTLDALGEIPVVSSAPAMAWSANVPAAAQPRLAEVPYQPLYFEEANLERYGRSAGTLQPAVSAGRFFGTIPLLPYAMANHPPGQANYWRWPYPAGWLAPRVREHEPINPKAAAVEATAATGLIFLLP